MDIMSLEIFLLKVTQEVHHLWLSTYIDIGMNSSKSKDKYGSSTKNNILKFKRERQKLEKDKRYPSIEETIIMLKGETEGMKNRSIH